MSVSQCCEARISRRLPSECGWENKSSPSLRHEQRGAGHGKEKWLLFRLPAGGCSGTQNRKFVVGAAGARRRGRSRGGSMACRTTDVFLLAASPPPLRPPVLLDTVVVLVAVGTVTMSSSPAGAVVAAFGGGVLRRCPNMPSSAISRHPSRHPGADRRRRPGRAFAPACAGVVSLWASVPGRPAGHKQSKSGLGADHSHCECGCCRPPLLIRERRALVPSLRPPVAPSFDCGVKKGMRLPVTVCTQGFCPAHVFDGSHQFVKVVVVVVLVRLSSETRAQRKSLNGREQRRFLHRIHAGG